MFNFSIVILTSRALFSKCYWHSHFSDFTHLIFKILLTFCKNARYSPNSKGRWMGHSMQMCIKIAKNTSSLSALTLNYSGSWQRPWGLVYQLSSWLLLVSFRWGSWEIPGQCTDIRRYCHTPAFCQTLFHLGWRLDVKRSFLIFVK